MSTSSTLRTEPLRSLVWAAAMTALLVAAGYAAHRWARLGPPAAETRPGSPWPHLTAWAVLGFGGFLVARRVAHRLGWNSLLVATPVFVAVRVGLPHRPDPALLYGYGTLVLAVTACAVLLWRPRSGRGGPSA
ncbi:hypothetical protein ACODT3_18045 [Streptomyces sp. 4.24]|uniref:hypothetical protein n=1 Tax=Streptomyces tritrimontium TaxID=3406573 RepID=UPI003BB72E83